MFFVHLIYANNGVRQIQLDEVTEAWGIKVERVEM